MLVAISGAGTETGKGVASDESTTPRGLVALGFFHEKALACVDGSLVSFAQRVDTSGLSAH